MEGAPLCYPCIINPGIPFSCDAICESLRDDALMLCAQGVLGGCPEGERAKCRYLGGPSFCTSLQYPVNGCPAKVDCECPRVVKVCEPIEPDPAEPGGAEGGGQRPTPTPTPTPRGGCEDPENEIYFNPRTGQCCPQTEWPQGEGCCPYEGIQPDGSCCSSGSRRCGRGCCAEGMLCINPVSGVCCPPSNVCGLNCCPSPGECQGKVGRCCPVDQQCGEGCCAPEERCERRGAASRCVDRGRTPAPPTPTPSPTPTVVVGHPPSGREVLLVE